MEARIHIRTILKRTYSGGRPGIELTPWTDVTDFIVGNFRVIQRSESTKWSYGVVPAGTLQVKLGDGAGKYAGAYAPDSVFSPFGMDKSQLRVVYPQTPGGSNYLTVWRGSLTPKTSGINLMTGVSTLRALSIDSVINRVTIPAGSVLQNSSLETAVRAIFNNAEIASEIGALTYSIPSPADILDGHDLRIADTVKFLGDERDSKAALGKILSAVDATIAYNPVSDAVEGSSSNPILNTKIIAFPRGELPTSSFKRIDLTEAITVTEFDEGEERVFNQIIVKTGLQAPEDKVIVESDSSIRQHGLRTLEIDLEWSRNYNAAEAVGERLRDRLAYPRPYIKVGVSIFEIGITGLQIGREVGLDIRDDGGLDDDRYSRGTYGSAKYGRLQFFPITGTYYIEDYQIVPDFDMVELGLRRK